MIAAILAGGEGRRIGGGKPARMLAGKTLLERAIARAYAWNCTPLVVARDRMQAAPCDIVHDRPGVEGPLAGLASAFDAACRNDAPSFLLMACDMPFLPDDVPQQLAREIAGGAGCAIARSGGRDIPVCSLWDVPALARSLPAYLAGGDRSLFGLANEVGYATAEYAQSQAECFVNINTPADLAAAEARFA